MQVGVNGDNICDEYLFTNKFCEFRPPIKLKFGNMCIFLEFINCKDTHVTLAAEEFKKYDKKSIMSNK